MTGLEVFVLAVLFIIAIILFGVYAYTAQVRFLGFGLVAQAAAFLAEVLWRANLHAS